MKTVIGAFDDANQAERAGQELVAAGVRRDDISIVANNEGGRYAPVNERTSGTTDRDSMGEDVGHGAGVGAGWGAGVGFLVGLTGLAIPGLGWIAGAGWLMGTVLGAATGAVVGGLVGALTHVGVPESDANTYNEAVRRGSTLVAVRAADEEAHRIARILDDNGAIDIDERAARFRTEGWMPGSATGIAPAGMGGTAAPLSTSAEFADTHTTERTTDRTNDRSGDMVLPVTEEQVAVGKRAVERGGVRVYTHVTERPVQEQVTLREEHVTVERRPVDRTVDPNTLRPLQEGVVEIRETAEVPVVSKEARVVEEVVVGKTATQHTETVQETARRTDVEVEEITDRNRPARP
ncbi:MAG: DUF2382 domain-containing protein [Capsulimonadales bacterium]|nr:DUF2382 domain-containing protein [Capsulimonadales bacterium]